MRTARPAPAECDVCPVRVNPSSETQGSEIEHIKVNGYQWDIHTDTIPLVEVIDLRSVGEQFTREDELW